MVIGRAGEEEEKGPDLEYFEGRFKDAELLEGVESVSGSQLDEMCTERLQKQNGFFFPVVMYMPLCIIILDVFSHCFQFW